MATTTTKANSTKAAGAKAGTPDKAKGGAAKAKGNGKAPLAAFAEAVGKNSKANPKATAPAKGTKPTKGDKTTKGDKAKAPVKRAPAVRNDTRMTTSAGDKISAGGKTRALLLYLLKADATSPKNAVSRDTVHEKVAGSAVTMWLSSTSKLKAPLLGVHVEEDKSRSLYLTKDGLRIAKAMKAQAGGKAK